MDKIDNLMDDNFLRGCPWQLVLIFLLFGFSLEVNWHYANYLALGSLVSWCMIAYIAERLAHRGHWDIFMMLMLINMVFFYTYLGQSLITITAWWNEIGNIRVENFHENF